ncbi:MAG: hypothetical protein KDE54_29180, partial [Caldilineaceae bacterium]|nr:hypothetical protein [Caldilineaceae bacterium]
VHGPWPGLSNLYDSRDLDITTDYRQVLSEVLIRRFANANLGTIFPGYANYQPLGIVQGADLQPNYAQATPTATPTLDPNVTPTPTREIGGTIPNSTPTPAPTDTGAPTATPTSSPPPSTGQMDKHIYIPVAARE